MFGVAAREIGESAPSTWPFADFWDALREVRAAAAALAALACP